MAKYVIFNDTTGKINRFIEVNETDITDNIKSGEDYLLTYELSADEFENYYVKNPGTTPELNARLILQPTWDKLFIDADGVDAATISGLPNPSYVKIYDEDQDQGIETAIATVTDGSASITLDTEGRVKMTIETDIYRPYVEYITTNTGTYSNIITMSTRYIDIRGLTPNVIENIGIDTATISITANDVDVRYGEIISIDLANITITTNTVVVNENVTVAVDRNNIKVRTYAANINEETAIDIDLATITMTANSVNILENATIEIDLAEITITANDVDYFDFGSQTIYADTPAVRVNTVEVEIVES